MRPTKLIALKGQYQVPLFMPCYFIFFLQFIKLKKIFEIYQAAPLKGCFIYENLVSSPRSLRSSDLMNVLWHYKYLFLACMALKLVVHHSELLDFPKKYSDTMHLCTSNLRTYVYLQTLHLNKREKFPPFLPQTILCFPSSIYTYIV